MHYVYIMWTEAHTQNLMHAKQKRIEEGWSNLEAEDSEWPPFNFEVRMS
jgi:hypothetical protein